MNQQRLGTISKDANHTIFAGRIKPMVGSSCRYHQGIATKKCSTSAGRAEEPFSEWSPKELTGFLIEEDLASIRETAKRSRACVAERFLVVGRRLHHTGVASYLDSLFLRI